MNTQIPIGTPVIDKRTGIEMRIDAYPMLKGEWIGGYICAWDGPNGYVRRAYFRPDELIIPD